MISQSIGRSYLTSLNISFLTCLVLTRTSVLLTLIKVKLPMRGLSIQSATQMKAVVDNRKDWRPSTFGMYIAYLHFKNVFIQGTWVAQSVKHLPSAQVMVLKCWDGAPCRVLCSAGSLLLLLPFSIPLPLHTQRSFLFSLSCTCALSLTK